MQMSLHEKSFTNFETSSLPHFLFPRFNVLTDAIIKCFKCFSIDKSEFKLSSVNDVILQGYYLPMYQNLKSDMIDFQ